MGEREKHQIYFGEHIITEKERTDWPRRLKDIDLLAARDLGIESTSLETVIAHIRHFMSEEESFENFSEYVESVQKKSVPSQKNISIRKNSDLEAVPVVPERNLKPAFLAMTGHPSLTYAAVTHGSKISRNAYDAYKAVVKKIRDSIRAFGPEDDGFTKAQKQVYALMDSLYGTKTIPDRRIV